MRSSPPLPGRAPGVRRHEVTRARRDAPFAAAAGLLALAGGAGMLAQSGLAGPLEAALGATAPAVVGAVLALLLGAGLGATAARGRGRLGAQPLVVAAAFLLGLAAVELLLPRAWAVLARAPLALRALVGGLVLLLPSLPTGAFFPLLAQGTARERGGSRRITLLFAVALAGGATGASLAACRYAPGAGLAAAVPVAAGLTALTGLLAFAVARRWPSSPASARAAAARRPHDGPSPLAMGSIGHGFFAGGALLVVAHAVHLAIGDAAGALPATLAGTLAGLAAGAAQTRTLLLHYRETALVRASAAAGLVLACALVVMGTLPGAALVLGGFLRAPADAALLHLLVATLAAALPAAWVGASFQLLVPHLGEDTVADGAGRSAGAGAAGATLGAAFAGVVLVPLLGSQRALITIALGFAALAIGIGWRGRAKRSALLTAFALVVVVVAAPRWDLAPAALGPGVRGAATWAREGISAGVVATTADGAVGTNGRTQGPTADDEALAELAATLAPRLSSAASPDELGVAAALFAAPWEHVTIPRVAPSWHPHLTAALRAAAEEPRAIPAAGRGLAGAARGAADALIVAPPSACGAGCARALAVLAHDALAPGGVALFSVREPEPLALTALLRAARAVFPHAGLAVTATRAVVLGGMGPLEPPPGRIEALAARSAAAPASGPAATTATAGIVALDAAVDACADAIALRADASLVTLRACASAAAPPAVVSR
jgi:spermidine synthase